MKYGEDALKEDENDPDVAVWYAASLGLVGEYSSVKERIGGAFVFKECIDRAVQQRPMDPFLHYLLGRWQFGVSERGGSVGWRSIGTLGLGGPLRA